jgi:dUTP pyrophosphatase
MIVEIARIHPDARLPQYKTAGAACFDLEALEEIVIPPGEIVDVRTGLVVRLPEGHVMILQPRSSSPKLGYVMPHSVGILDSDYCGPNDEILIRVKNVTDQPITFEKQQRIAQAYVAPIPKVEWREIAADGLTSTSRGGFGSTGKK